MKPEQPVKPVLIFAYGNPSRGDDALGPECLSAMEGWLQGNSLQSQIELLTDFQLQVEHATDLVGRRLVVFVDASVSVPAPFEFTRLQADEKLGITTHAMSPGGVLAVYRDIYREAPPDARLLSIRGHNFSLGSGLSEAAAGHLSAALDYLQAFLKSEEPVT